MANSIDDFLAKASPEVREKFEADVKDATSGKQMSESERIAKQAKEANSITEHNDPNKGQVQSPQEAQKDQNAVDKALVPQVKAETKQIGQTMEKHLSPPQNDRDR